MRVFRPRILILTCGLVLFLAFNGYLVWSKVFKKTGDPALDERGFLCKQYVDPEDRTHNYLVFVPYDYEPGQKRPLLLFLNGFGENGTDGWKAISNNLGFEIGEMRRTFPFVVAIPHCEPGKSWIGGEDKKALAIMDRVAEEYGTDPDRACLLGISSGGGGAWHIASEHPERFAAVIPLCGVPTVDAEKLAHLPIWNIYNAKDEASLVETNRKFYRQLLEAGASPIVTEFRDAGHNCWIAGLRLPSLYDWMLDQSRAKNRKQTQRFRLLAAKDLVAKWSTVGPAQLAVLADETLGVERQEEQRPAYLISDVAYPTCEFHVEVWLPDRAQSCELALVDSDQDVSGDGPIDGYTLQLPFPEHGSGGLSHSTDGWVATLDPAAQRQLRTDYWNDVRLHFGGERVLVRVNGWKAIDVRAPLKGKTLRVALVAPGGANGIQWRNVRLRETD
ncbi:MAG: DUF1080 domain-containing protein [Pirellulales bacterium]|nr:DUF1080 domain-containing protein [Pirellulales bacterium]